MKKLAYITILAILMILPGCSSMVRVKHSLQGVSKISIQELKMLLDDKDVTILDARDVPDWQKSNAKIPSAIRANPDNLTAWVDKYDKERRTIVYCA
ncbi:MAG: rhodanese-like domain-containing protein [Thermodesulfobacteriota bacterium]